MICPDSAFAYSLPASAATSFSIDPLTDTADRCVDRLMSEMRGREGVENAHVVPARDGQAAQLCIHFDPAILPLPRIRELVTAAGAGISERFGHATWRLDIPHERRARTIAEKLRTLPGVLDAEASAAGIVRVEFDRSAASEASLARELNRMQIGTAAEPGLSAEEHAGHAHPPGKHGASEAGHDHEGGILGPNTELIFALSCGGLLACGYLIERFFVAPALLPFAFYLGAYAFGGFFTLREAIDNLRLKRFEIDTLMLVAAAGAAALGAWAEGALLLFLFSLGHALEHYAMGRAKRAIEALAELAPRTALVRRGGDLREVPVEELAIGDVVVVKPDARLPADGFVVAGESSVNQAPVTGESIPADKQAVADVAAARANPDRIEAAHRVFAGTINGSGAIEIEVTRKSTDSALAKVVRMVSEAETQKSPTQRFTEKFERVFVPGVLALAVLLLFAWVVVDEPFRDSFYRAMAVLVAASPCALAIATPSAVLSGVARAARGGVLVKGGGPLENLGSLSAIARQVGLDEAWGDLMPEDKVEAIKKLRAEEKVAMVGDGVNDAPAMANATVGIVMGAVGSDVAMETADVALMADDLANLPFAVGLSRTTRSVILQNVFVSLGVVALLVPATIFGLGIGPAVAVHEGSTLLVVFNALRLLGYRDNRP